MAEEKSPQDSRDASGEGDEVVLVGETSPGVRRIQAIAKHITRLDRIFIFVSIFIIAYCYGLDNTLRYVYQVRLPDIESETATDKIQAVCNCILFPALPAGICQRYSCCYCSCCPGKCHLIYFVVLVSANHYTADRRQDRRRFR